mmetsp:Transcript_97453/g.303526  ORF Transcript_97453/g.303526 Transcript_97453/m.303526 type:complete len:217 (-) Transcript_97453:10-660(-)
MQLCGVRASLLSPPRSSSGLRAKGGERALRAGKVDAEARGHADELLAGREVRGGQRAAVLLRVVADDRLGRLLPALREVHDDGGLEGAADLGAGVEAARHHGVDLADEASGAGAAAHCQVLRGDLRERRGVDAKRLDLQLQSIERARVIVGALVVGLQRGRDLHVRGRCDSRKSSEEEQGSAAEHGWMSEAGGSRSRSAVGGRRADGAVQPPGKEA